jgi:hypothetical protein
MVIRQILYTIFIASLLEKEEMLAFADDQYVYKLNQSLVSDMKKSGMKVNETKTEACLFYKNEKAPIKLSINNSIATSDKAINMLI